MKSLWSKEKSEMSDSILQQECGGHSTVIQIQKADMNIQDLEYLLV